MPGKSRHSKGKHPALSKKRKRRQGSLAIATHQPPVSQPEVSRSSVIEPTPMATMTSVRSPYVVTELRRIGILAGVMLAILVVLALVLS